MVLTFCFPSSIVYEALGRGAVVPEDVGAGSVDVLSLLPYSLMFSEIKAAGLRVIRLVRLLDSEISEATRIMAKLRQFVTMPIKQQTLIKYFFIIFFIIHWTACTLRLLTSFAVGDCRPKGSDMHSGLPFDDECARTYLNTNRRWGQGPWSQYASAIIWSIGAMSGEAYLPANMEETVLNTGDAHGHRRDGLLGR